MGQFNEKENMDNVGFKGPLILCLNEICYVNNVQIYPMVTSHSRVIHPHRSEHIGTSTLLSPLARLVG